MLKRWGVQLLCITCMQCITFLLGTSHYTALLIIFIKHAWSITIIVCRMLDIHGLPERYITLTCQNLAINHPRIKTRTRMNFSVKQQNFSVTFCIDKNVLHAKQWVKTSLQKQNNLLCNFNIINWWCKEHCCWGTIKLFYMNGSDKVNYALLIA